VCHFATLLALASLRASAWPFSYSHSRRHPRLKVYPHLPHSPSYKTPLKIPSQPQLAGGATVGGHAARQSKTYRTTTGNDQDQQCPGLATPWLATPWTSNSQDYLVTPRTRIPGQERQGRESRNKTLKITSGNEDQNAQETPKNNGQHALNSRSPLVTPKYPRQNHVISNSP
jgi:hypothetical protein